MFKIIRSLSISDEIKDFLGGGKFVNYTIYGKDDKLDDVEKIDSKEKHTAWVDKRVKDTKFLKLFKWIFLVETIIPITVIIYCLYNFSI